MRVVAEFSFNDGASEVKNRWPHLLAEVQAALGAVDAEDHRTKRSEEKTMLGKVLYSPTSINKAIKSILTAENGWNQPKRNCEYSTDYYINGYKPVIDMSERRPYREMDFQKEKLGIEVQFGKYAFMVYNVAAKMTIFRNLGYIDAGVEIVPVKDMTENMSTGVSYFEQFVWDLEQRGNADIDVPVLIWGIAP